MKALFLLISCSFFYQTPGVAQAGKRDNDARVEMTQAAVSALQSGGLVVRLSTNAKKIAAMEEVLNRDELTPLNRSRLQQRLTETIEETRTQNLLLIQALRDKYTLGPLYFIPDTSFTLLNEETKQGFFYNDELALDPSIAQPNGDILIMRIGYTDGSEAARAEAFILSNMAMEDLVAPFPGAVTFDNLGLMFNKILAPEMAEKRRIEGAVKRLVKKLTVVIARQENW